MKLLLLSYTNDGEYLVEQYSNDELTFNDMTDIWDYKFELFPLFPILVYLMMYDKTSFLNKCVSLKVIKYSTKDVEIILTNLGLGQTNVNVFLNNYYYICSQIFGKKMFRDEFYYYLMSEYIKVVTKIIKDAPKLEDSLIVYKQFCRFLPFQQNNLYRSHRIMTTNILDEISTYCDEHEECFHKILLLKHSSCLFSYYNNYENKLEILLPPDIFFYKTSKIYHTKNKRQRCMNIVAT